MLLLYIIRCLPIAGGAPKSHDVPKITRRAHTHTHTHTQTDGRSDGTRRLRYRLEQTRVGGRLKKNETTEGGNVSKVERNTVGLRLAPHWTSYRPRASRFSSSSCSVLCVCAGAAFTFALFGHDFSFFTPSVYFILFSFFLPFFPFYNLLHSFFFWAPPSGSFPPKLGAGTVTFNAFLRLPQPVCPAQEPPPGMYR
jgi:fatty acid desaturase